MDVGSDAVEFVRSHPAMFFPEGRPSALACARQLVTQALALGGTLVSVQRVSDWWIVSSDGDWFLPGPVAEQFRRLTPLPELGVNTTRVEVVLTAFASAVATKERGTAWVTVSGEPPQIGDVAADAARSVAFRFLQQNLNLL